MRGEGEWGWVLGEGIAVDEKSVGLWGGETLRDRTHTLSDQPRPGNEETGWRKEVKPNRHFQSNRLFLFLFFSPCQNGVKKETQHDLCNECKLI